MFPRDADYYNKLSEICQYLFKKYFDFFQKYSRHGVLSVKYVLCHAFFFVFEVVFRSSAFYYGDNAVQTIGGQRKLYTLLSVQSARRQMKSDESKEVHTILFYARDCVLRILCMKKAHPNFKCA